MGMAHGTKMRPQDQLSLPYLLQKFVVNYGIFLGTVYKNKYLNIQD